MKTGRVILILIVMSFLSSSIGLAESPVVPGQICFNAHYGLIEWPVGVVSVQLDYETVNLNDRQNGQLDLSSVVKGFDYLEQSADNSFDESLAALKFNDNAFTDLLVRYQVYKFIKILPELSKFDTLSINKRTGEARIKRVDANQSFILYFDEGKSVDTISMELKELTQIRTVNKVYYVSDL